MDHVVNGWSLSPIVTFASGTPFTVSSGKQLRLVDHRPAERGWQSDSRPEPSAFGGYRAVVQHNRVHRQPVGTDGNAARNLLDAPGFRNVDMGIFRDFRVREQVRLQFRAEFTNFFNLVSLNAPNATLTSANFGQITSAQPMRQCNSGCGRRSEGRSTCAKSHLR